MAASKSFSYKFTGDTPKLFRGVLIRPGDPIDSDDELIMGEFEPQNAAAKSAKSATDKANDAAAGVAADERLRAMRGSLAVQLDEAASPAPSPAATSSAASAAPAEG